MSDKLAKLFNDMSDAFKGITLELEAREKDALEKGVQHVLDDFLESSINLSRDPHAEGYREALTSAQMFMFTTEVMGINSGKWTVDRVADYIAKHAGRQDG